MQKYFLFVLELYDFSTAAVKSLTIGFEIFRHRPQQTQGPMCRLFVVANVFVLGVSRDLGEDFGITTVDLHWPSPLERHRVATRTSGARCDWHPIPAEIVARKASYFLQPDCMAVFYSDRYCKIGGVRTPVGGADPDFDFKRPIKCIILCCSSNPHAFLTCLSGELSLDHDGANDLSVWIVNHLNHVMCTIKTMCT